MIVSEEIDDIEERVEALEVTAGQAAEEIQPEIEDLADRVETVEAAQREGADLADLADRVEALESAAETETRGNDDEFFPSGPVHEEDQEAADRIEELEEKVRGLGMLIRSLDIYSKLFIANNSANNGTFQELIASGGAIVPFADGRKCNDSTHSSALLSLTAGQALVMEMYEPSYTRFVNVGQPAVASSSSYTAWLTQIGGANGDDGSVSGTASFPTYIYNAYWDAAKTQLAGGTLTVQAHRLLQIQVTPASLGLIQKNGTNPDFLLMAVLDEYYGRDSCAAQTTGMP